jgi:hypothetical protein
MKWQKIQIGDNMSLDLDNTNDAKIWAVLRFNPDIKGSPFQVQNPYFEVYDPEIIAKQEIGEVAQMKKAFERITMIEDKPIDMVHFCRFLGEEIRENASFDIVSNTLLKFARNYPEEFNKKWESRTRSYGERFATARFLGIITQDIDEGFFYQNIPLGQNEEDVIRFLSKDHNILSSINSIIEEKDNVIKTIKQELDYKESKKEDKIERKEKVKTGEFD